jgi:3-hydroxyacyl-CoA dehydrogenase
VAWDLEIESARSFQRSLGYCQTSEMTAPTPTHPTVATIPKTAYCQSHGDVAVITLDNPPVNGMDLATRKAMVQGINRAIADDAIVAIVITGAGKAFSGGADIREFGTPLAFEQPNLHDLIALVEGASKPVISAMHSVVMGGGLELSLGCHYRIVTPGTRLGLPEVKIGLLPGAGGTQRLPRALGVEPALNIIASGDAVACEVLAAVPGQKLFDRVASSADSLLTEALTLARAVAPVRPLPRVRDLPCSHPLGDAFFQAARDKVGALAANYPAPLRCIEAVQVATRTSFADGAAWERQAFMDLMATPESRALRHLFFAERAASKIRGVSSDTPLRPIRSVAVVGAGTMGGGIAMNFLNADLPVRLVEASEATLDRGVATIRKNYEAQVTKGKLTQPLLERRMALLTPTLSYEDLNDADLVIEAVFEDMAVKQNVFRQLDRVMKAGAILASNTSTLNLNTIAAFTGRRQDVVGLHFFSPANVMQLLEIVRGDQTAADVMATAMALAKTIRKTAVVAGVCDGFIGNRMIEQYLRQAGFLLDEGCTPQQVDRAMEHFGMAMGPFRMSDLAGNDIGWAIRKRRALEQPQMKYSKTADLLCEQGRFGQKTGAGWYDYAPGQRDALPSAAVAELIDARRRSLGITPRQIGDQEIVQRLLFALVNEAAHLLEEGIAQRASDIDLAYIYGYGFPPYRGGPLRYADEMGLGEVVKAMRRFAANPLDDAAFWTPAPMLAGLVSSGKSFN